MACTDAVAIAVRHKYLADVVRYCSETGIKENGKFQSHRSILADLYHYTEYDLSEDSYSAFLEAKAKEIFAETLKLWQHAAEQNIIRYRSTLDRYESVIDPAMHKFVFLTGRPNSRHFKKILDDNIALYEHLKKYPHIPSNYKTGEWHTAFSDQKNVSETLYLSMLEMVKSITELEKEIRERSKYKMDRVRFIMAIIGGGGAVELIRFVAQNYL